MKYIHVTKYPTCSVPYTVDTQVNLEAIVERMVAQQIEAQIRPLQVQVMTNELFVWIAQR